MLDKSLNERKKPWFKNEQGYSPQFSESRCVKHLHKFK